VLAGGTGRFHRPYIKEGGSWGKHGFPHGSKPKASDAQALTVALRVRAYRRVGLPCGPGLRGCERGRHGVGSESSDAAMSKAGCSGRGSDLMAQ
jgi:hypothetical protein